MTGELTLLFTAAERIGYGRLGVKLAAALRARGMALQDSFDPATPTNVLATVSYPSHLRGWVEGQHLACFTMFEATRLPEPFVETLHEYRTVLVPSVQNVELFSNYHPNVRLCLLGVGDEWRFVERTPPGRFFDFLCGGSGPRKGVDLVVDAFTKAFSTWPDDAPIPRLILKAPKPQDAFGDRIEQINGYLSAEEEVGLYARSHCYVQPSRGEGFGLQPLQAICQGLPTILTAAHGHESFAHLGYGVDADLVDVPSGYFMLGDAGQWWEPRLDDLIDRMRYVYEHYEEASGAAAVTAGEAARLFTWDLTAESFVQAIGPDEFIRPYASSGKLCVPSLRLFRIVTSRDYYAEIAGRALHFTAGETYWDTADVKRVLFEGGVLDPSCLTGLDVGVDPADVDAYNAHKAYCPTCGTRMGTGVTKADELMAALDLPTGSVLT